MRYLVALLALAGVVVSYLALRVHYSNDVEPCSINEKWDCGVVNHSPFAVLGGMPVFNKIAPLRELPVAAVGIAGYLGLGALALMRRKRLALAAAVAGVGFSLYLTHIEKDVLMVWCVYCVSSLGIISLIALISLAWAAMGGRGQGLGIRE